MKNFDRPCLISGTSALQSGFEHTLQGRGVIVEFPVDSLTSARTTSECFAPAEQGEPVQGGRLTLRDWIRARCSSLIQSLPRSGFSGCAFNRVKPWQAVIAGCTFTALSFASLFLGL